MDTGYSIGKVIGFFFSYCLFTAILFMVFNYVKGGASLPIIAAITAGISIVGYSIRRIL